jgi:hypothetical protein
MGRVACRAGDRTHHQEDGGRAGAKPRGQVASCHLACGRGQYVWWCSAWSRDWIRALACTFGRSLCISSFRPRAHPNRAAEILGCLFIRLVPMDFSPVPAGTDAAQALTLRGPDTDVVYSIADSFHTVMSAAPHARPGVAANQRRASFSRVGGALAGDLFTRDFLSRTRCGCDAEHHRRRQASRALVAAHC